MSTTTTSKDKCCHVVWSRHFLISAMQTCSTGKHHMKERFAQNLRGWTLYHGWNNRQGMRTSVLKIFIQILPLKLHQIFIVLSLKKWSRTSATGLVTLILYQFCHCIHHNARIWLAQTVHNCLIYIVVVNYGFTKNFVRRKYNKNRLFSTRVINWHLQIPVIFLIACIYSAGVNPTNFCDEF